MKQHRRTFIKAVGIVTGGVILAPGLAGQSAFAGPVEFILPPLPYKTNALEPAIDMKTMEIHHGKHHQAYVNNLNKAVTESPAAQGKSLEQLLAGVSAYSPALRNNAGGHWNHTFFWKSMKPGGSMPGKDFANAVESGFRSMDELKKAFGDAAKSRFGSGWAWLILKQGGLEICSSPNQDNPLMDLAEVKGTPLLGLDVWEHAYYLKYQNRRAEYIDAWWSIVDWEEVSRRYGLAMKG
jgi:superoxide dismutase, Fe-Mn family